MQTHQFSVTPQLSNSASHQVLLSSSNWETPPIVTLASPFYAFGATDMLAVQCDYLNPENLTITTGDDYSVDESCMSLSHFCRQRRRSSASAPDMDGRRAATLQIFTCARGVGQNDSAFARRSFKLRRFRR
jgi:hypothetical protein